MVWTSCRCCVFSSSALHRRDGNSELSLAELRAEVEGHEPIARLIGVGRQDPQSLLQHAALWFDIDEQHARLLPDEIRVVCRG